MVDDCSPSSVVTSPRKIAIIFRYARANIYSYHSLIGSLEIHPELSSIPIFLPKPSRFLQQLNSLLSKKEFDQLLVGVSLTSFQLSDVLSLVKGLNNHPGRSKITIVATNAVMIVTILNINSSSILSNAFTNLFVWLTNDPPKLFV